ncbi:MAG TPA: hypothetical protein VGG99_07980 [Acetobacteraceae bacterium]|jgi:hypothetical protein
MGDLNTPPAEAYAPDPDRADPDSPDLMPEWLAYLIALVILFLLEQFQAIRQRHPPRPASRPAGRLPLPQDSAQPPAPAIRSQSSDPTARTRRSRGVALDCSELSRTRAALLEKLRQSDVDPAVLSQLEALGIVPGPIGPDTATAAAPALTPLCVAKIRRNPRRLAPAIPQHAVSPTSWQQIPARAGTGPPTGPPAISRCQSCYA